MRPTVRVRFFPGRSAVSLSHSCVGPRIRIAGAQSKIARVRHNPLMRIHIGTDHAGFELKNHLKDHWRRAGHEVVDHGSHEYDPGDDYPEFCFACAEGVIADPGSLGVVLGGSGNGEQIAANKVPGVRPPWCGPSRPRAWPASTMTPTSPASVCASTPSRRP